LLWWRQYYFTISEIEREELKAVCWLTSPVTVNQPRNINAANEMRLLNVVTGFFPLLELDH